MASTTAPPAKTFPPSLAVATLAHAAREAVPPKPAAPAPAGSNMSTAPSSTPSAGYEHLLRTPPEAVSCNGVLGVASNDRAEPTLVATAPDGPHREPSAVVGAAKQSSQPADVGPRVSPGQQQQQQPPPPASCRRAMWVFLWRCPSGARAANTGMPAHVAEGTRARGRRSNRSG